MAVYLDGYKWHAAPDKNRLAEDADTRAQVRADEKLVFQLDWESVTGGEDVPWPPYQGNGQANARNVYRRFGGRAAAAVAGLLQQPGAELTGLDDNNLAERLVASLLGNPLPDERNGRVSMIRVQDDSGLPITVIVDKRVPPAGGWTALAVIDDRLPVIESDKEAHWRRWRAWLYWGNLVQFLDYGAGDGDQIAFTNLQVSDPRVLAYALKVAGSQGLRSHYGKSRHSVVEESP